jgi:hypothetical protein
MKISHDKLHLKKSIHWVINFVVMLQLKMNSRTWYIFYYWELNSSESLNFKGGGLDRIVARFTTTYAISAYHH